MKKSSYHLYHISMLGSMLHYLKSSGVSLDNLTRGTMIRKFDLNSPSTYLPIMVHYEFLEKVRNKLGIDNLSLAYCNHFKVDDLSDFGSHLTKCYDLQAVLEEGVRLNYQVQTNGKLRLDIKGATTFLTMTHLDGPGLGRLLSEEIEFTMMHDAIRMVLGHDWTPVSVFLTTEKGYWIERLFPNTDFNVYTNAQFTSLEFRTEDLKRKNPGYVPNKFPIDKGELDLTSSVSQILSCTRGDHLPTLSDLARFYGVSKRTIDRTLIQNGTSFSKLRQKNLESRAIQLIKNEQLSIHDIGSSLGFSNTPNFIRAFKNWFNETPGHFRRTL